MVGMLLVAPSLIVLLLMNARGQLSPAGDSHPQVVGDLETE